MFVCVPRAQHVYSRMGAGGMMLQHTTPMEAFFAVYVFIFSLIAMLGANPTYNYDFFFDYKVNPSSQSVFGVGDCDLVLIVVDRWEAASVPWMGGGVMECVMEVWIDESLRAIGGVLPISPV